MTLTTQQQDLLKRARALARETIAPRAAEVDRSEQYPWDNVKALCDAGFFGMTIPKAYGGAGLGFLEAALVVDEVAQVCGVSGRIVVEANMGSEAGCGIELRAPWLAALRAALSTACIHFAFRWPSLGSAVFDVCRYSTLSNYTN